MSKKFNDTEMQRKWEQYEDYVALHSGQAYCCMSFDEWLKSRLNEGD